ncbi:hypothetical protein [Aliarcobacter butzleri]|uniref:hypothetical protein n=1 Tax=Aliarcobacter butzleri TaxID=28197 RepID=UPI001EDA14AA|nr:hypothetical protein [Aliarcobacter butzleri]MCG3686497.1 hypothetical protein [Aliarcobacter butzleri]
MIATKKDLKAYIGKDVWILPTGNNKSRKKSNEDNLYSCKLLKITSTNAYFDNNYVGKLRLDGNYDNNNCSGLIFLTKENALNYLWTTEFRRKIKYDLDLSELSFEDLKQIENIINKYQE